MKVITVLTDEMCRAKRHLRWYSCDYWTSRRIVPSGLNKYIEREDAKPNIDASIVVRNVNLIAFANVLRGRNSAKSVKRLLPEKIQNTLAFLKIFCQALGWSTTLPNNYRYGDDNQAVILSRGVRLQPPARKELLRNLKTTKFTDFNRMTETSKVHCRHILAAFTQDKGELLIFCSFRLLVLCLKFVKRLWTRNIFHVPLSQSWRAYGRVLSGLQRCEEPSDAFLDDWYPYHDEIKQRTCKAFLSLKVRKSVSLAATISEFSPLIAYGSKLLTWHVASWACYC